MFTTSFLNVLVSYSFLCVFRRKAALLWDVCQTSRNAKIYNEEDSEIVQDAEKLVTILTTFIR